MTQRTWHASRPYSGVQKHFMTPTPGSGQSDVFNEAEAAAYLHQKTRTIRDWRAKRGLPCFKPTAKVTLYRRADLDEWLDRSRVAFPPRSNATCRKDSAPTPTAEDSQG
jgi:hypothetical protein